MRESTFIEKFFPIGDVSEESVRERRAMSALPPNYYLHVWWARRPLIASRAAVLGSVSHGSITSNEFLKAIGILGDPQAARDKIDVAKKLGNNLGPNPYGYERAFKVSPNIKLVSDFIKRPTHEVTILDPTAGGGAIPFEAARLGFNVISNDLNPVASLIQKATIEYPYKYGSAILKDFDTLAKRFLGEVDEVYRNIYPQEKVGVRVDGYLWSRTIKCPYCDGVVPLSPNWKINSKGVGVRLCPDIAQGPGSAGRRCRIEIVYEESNHSKGTVSRGDASCPYPDCARAIGGEHVKKQAQDGDMGEQLYAVVFRNPSTGKGGRKGLSSVKNYRAPTDADLAIESLKRQWVERADEWYSRDLIPNERIDSGSKTDEALRYGANEWTDMFSPRQLMAHVLAVDLYRSQMEEDSKNGDLSEIRKASFVYLSFALDKLRDYNSRMTRWIAQREVPANTFDSHNFAMKWSYSEMAHAAVGEGLRWVVGQVRKSLKELIELVNTEEAGLFGTKASKPSITITNGSAANMEFIDDGSIDAVVMDPPYGANVMYAELSDFFYVWLKRTAGLAAPELFTRRLADKDAEAVANQAHFKGQKGMARLAEDDYRVKMEGIFAECRRVLKDDGIMTVMFTHKETGAWDALAMSLMDAGFVITASWPVNTEASGSLHIKDKAAANSTIFLVCRPREEKTGEETMYWEDVEPEVAKAVRDRVGEFQEAGIKGVDLYLASFGPALEAFSRHWPLTRGTPAPEPKRKRRKQGDMFEEFDPYAVRPEDALNAARREVKAWRLAQLASAKAQADMDGPTAFYVLAWDAFKAVAFPYDEALRLARAVGVDLDTQIIGRLAEKKAAVIKLWDSATRVAKGAIGPKDGARGMIDALHHAAHTVRTGGVDAAVEQLELAGIGQDDEFKVALEALLEVLPPSKTFSGVESDKAVQPAADDFDALEKLRRIAYGNEIGEPQQLDLYRELMDAQ